MLNFGIFKNKIQEIFCSLESSQAHSAHILPGREIENEAHHNYSFQKHLNN